MKKTIVIAAVLAATLSLAADNRGYRLDGSQEEANRQQEAAEFVVRLRYPFDWTWFEIEKPFAWEFVDAKVLAQDFPHKRLIPQVKRMRDLRGRFMALYEFDMIGLTNAVAASPILKQNIVVVVHPGFSREKGSNMREATKFRNAMLSLGFTNVWFQRGLSMGSYPITPLTKDDKEVQQSDGEATSEPAPVPGAGSEASHP